MDIWLIVLFVVAFLIVGVPTIYGVLEGLIDGLAERRYTRWLEDDVEYHKRIRNKRNSVNY